MIPKRDIQIFRDIYYAKYFSGGGKKIIAWEKNLKLRGKLKMGKEKLRKIT